MELDVRFVHPDHQVSSDNAHIRERSVAAHLARHSRHPIAGSRADLTMSLGSSRCQYARVSVFRNAQRIPFLWWILVVWSAMTLSGAVAGSIWGMGIHCEARIPDGDFPCANPIDPDAAELASSAFVGALRSAIGYGVVAGGPAIAFAVTVTIFGWVFRNLVDRRSALWPWMTLTVGSGVVAVMLVRSEEAGNMYSWVGLSAFIVMVAVAIRQTYREWTLADSIDGAVT